MSRENSIEEIMKNAGELYAAAAGLDEPDRSVAFEAAENLRRLLERLAELEALVVEAWEEGWRAGWDREPEKDAWRESNTRQALDTGGTDV